MRIASSIAIGLALTLLPPIGSGGTGTVKPEGAHVDRALFTGPGDATADLRAADNAAMEAVMTVRPGRVSHQD